jgi:hypothetical protein
MANLDAPEIGGIAHAVPVIAALVEAQLAEERARGISLEQRGIGVITTSSALVTLLGGLAAIVLRERNAHLHTFGRGSMIVALVLFALAAASGIGANLPRGHQVPNEGAEGLAGLLDPKIFRGAVAAVDRRIVEARLTELASLRRTNDAKAQAVLVALISQVLALVAVAMVVVSLIRGTT